MKTTKNRLIVSALAVFLLSSCGMFSKRSEDSKHAKSTQILSPGAVTPEPTTVAPPAALQTVEISTPPEVSEKKHVEISTPVVSADTSLKWLKNGNIRFVKKTFRADGRSAKDRERLTKGQHPHAIVLACSDSRVPPEIVFDQTLGEIFVIRVMGEALDSTVIATIEYAVEHLHTGLLVVMGHSQCGAVQAAINAVDGVSNGSADIDKVLADIRPRLVSMKTEPASSNLEVESTLNADGVARDLVKRSEILRNAVDTGSLVIKSALYRGDTGKVTFY